MTLPDTHDDDAVTNWADETPVSEGLPTVLDWLRSPNLTLRWAACRALERWETPLAREALEAQLAIETSPYAHSFIQDILDDTP